jgi:hypothetical protein
MASAPLLAGKYYLVANLFLDSKAFLFVNFDFESLIFSESSLY